MMDTQRGREPIEQPVTVAARDITLEGSLTIPTKPYGIVLFAHGSGSSRHSPRNRFVARELNGAGLGTLLVDLLTPQEEAVDVVTRQHRFDINLLAKRLLGSIEWLRQRPETRELRIGLFGASTGAAAALIAAAERSDQVGAVVSRGGRPDLADEALHRVYAPALLIVGGRDRQVIELNEMALAQLKGEKRLEIVPGATHLFEEPGTLERVAQLASSWFAHYLSGAHSVLADTVRGETLSSAEGS